MARLIGRFATEDPPELARQLEQFERDINGRADDVRKGSMRRPASRVVVQSGESRRLAPNTMVVCYTVTDDVSVVLPPAGEVVGEELCFVKPIAANSVSVRSSGGEEIQAGASPVSATAVGLYKYVSDGFNYWRV